MDLPPEEKKLHFHLRASACVRFWVRLALRNSRRGSARGLHMVLAVLFRVRGSSGWGPAVFVEFGPQGSSSVPKYTFTLGAQAFQHVSTSFPVGTPTSVLSSPRLTVHTLGRGHLASATAVLLITLQARSTLVRLKTATGATFCLRSRLRCCVGEVYG